MTTLPKQQKLTAAMARKYAWLSVGVTVAAFAVWGATIYDLLVQDRLRAAGAAFCAVSLSIAASILARTAVRSIERR